MNEQDIINIKKKFPIFKKNIRQDDLYYLDNSAITHVPSCTINALTKFYSTINSNVHRGAYYLSEKATEKYEASRAKITEFIGADNTSSCVFVKSTTEAINLVANSYVKPRLKEDDEILISHMEHHSNIVPWYILQEEIKIKIKIIPLLISGDLDYNLIDKLITKKTKFISITHISNAIGTINDIKRIIKIANEKKIPILIDGAQSFLYNKINLKELNCDFFTISSHKMYGPNGLGVLYAKKTHLENMKPYQGGGEMIKYVSFSKILWNDIPYKFEAGTQPIANIIALGSTIDFLNKLDLKSLYDYKRKLTEYALNRLTDIKNVTLIGSPINRAGIISFNIDGIHSHDFGTIASHYGVCVRTGHHCAMPIMDFYNISSTIRISLGIYNYKKDIDKLIEVILKTKEIFK